MERSAASFPPSPIWCVFLIRAVCSDDDDRVCATAAINRAKDDECDGRGRLKQPIGSNICSSSARHYRPLSRRRYTVEKGRRLRRSDDRLELGSARYSL
uniref:Secreted protein n=1 Tax=Plectus sambesii TaxID=2011161 RepID=A0A914W5K9_9BILA